MSTSTTSGPRRLAAAATAAATAASAVLALAVTGGSPAGASAPPAASAPAAAAPSAQDLAYLTFAAQANLAEIAQGKLARRIASSRDVRQFGRDMVVDHRQQYAALESVATTLGVALPTRPSREQRRIVRLWSHLGSHGFTCAYVPFQWDDHQLVIAMTTMEATQGTEPTVKQAAAASLPVLEEHFEHATMLVRELRSC
jgi:putative membrane protein